MGKLLVTWIKDQTQKHVSPSTRANMAKGKNLLVLLKEKAKSNYDIEFTASSGWFKRFKNRRILHNVKVSDESASADVRAA